MLKISVVVPVYNGADTIAQCIESLLGQDYPADRYDVIVVENGSTDDTTAIVERYPVRLYRSPKRGVAQARNFGIAKTDADIIAMLDADCVAEKNWLTELARPYADPEIGGVGGPILDFVHPNLTFVERFAAECHPLTNFFIPNKGEFLPRLYGANCSYRRELLVRVGLMDTRLPMAHDVEISWRVQLQAGVRLAYAPDAVVYHYHRSTRKGLARQYRRYGFGEIMLDTLYNAQPGYPRHLGFQLRRLAQQCLTLPRYIVSMGVRRIRRRRGRATDYDVAVPGLWFLIESSNILGKLEALIATRLMRSANDIFEHEPDAYIDRFFQTQKE